MVAEVGKRCRVRKPLSVVAENGQTGLARSGEPATGERVLRPESRFLSAAISEKGSKGPLAGGRRRGPGKSSIFNVSAAEAVSIVRPNGQRASKTHWPRLDGDATSEVSPLSVSMESTMTRWGGGISWLKRAERRWSAELIDGAQLAA
jgi:hypothetical protein